MIRQGVAALSHASHLPSEADDECNIDLSGRAALRWFVAVSPRAWAAQRWLPRVPSPTALAHGQRSGDRRSRDATALTASAIPAPTPCCDRSSQALAVVRQTSTGKDPHRHARAGKRIGPGNRGAVTAGRRYRRGRGRRRHMRRRARRRADRSTALMSDDTSSRRDGRRSRCCRRRRRRQRSTCSIARLAARTPMPQVKAGARSARGPAVAAATDASPGRERGHPDPHALRARRASPYR